MIIWQYYLLLGVGVGMSDDNDGTGGLAGLVSWLIITTLLSTSTVAMFMGVDVARSSSSIWKNTKSIYRYIIRGNRSKLL